jgi:predicted metal-dependent phosphoesterase TrpH/glycosyltransferase involved in cell wall biosynthesis
MTEPLAIAQFTPFPWEEGGEVNGFVRKLSEGLAERGHRVLVAAPGGSRAEVRESRSVLERAIGDAAFPAKPGAGPLNLSMGGLSIPRGTGRRPAPVSVDTGNRVEEMLSTLAPDIVHVHDPFLPGFSSTALRHSFSLNVGTFHETSERPFATLVARPFLEIFFGRLDARTVSSMAAAEQLNRFFPGAQELIYPGTDPVGSERDDGPPLRIAFTDFEEKGALRTFLRALRRLPPELDWTASIYSENPGAVDIRVARKIRERIKVIGPDQASLARLLAASQVFVASSGGPAPSPSSALQAMASGAVPVLSSIPRYRELADDGRCALLFSPGDVETLAGQIVRLADDPALAKSISAAGPGRTETWDEVTDAFELIYRDLTDRRHEPGGNPTVARRLAGRDLIDVDLHMHTDHSPDCATPVEVLIETARDRGFGAIAITDHNEVSGAIEAARIADEMDDFKVIVAEEVKTAEQGEVIGLFLEEKIPKGLTMAETIAEIRRQGGLVYVPHPFDRLHSVPDYEHLLDIVEEIDLIEVFNPRVAITSFNEEAERFAAKYRIIPAAGSDSHVAQGLGAVRVRIPDFDGPEEFLEAMRQAEITRKHKNLVYVQALKFLQTTGRPGPARRSVENAQPAKGGQRRSGRAGKR